MLTSKNVINIQPYNIMDCELMKSIVRNKNKMFFEKFSIKNIKLEVCNTKFYKNHSYLLVNKSNEISQNQHQDLANFRLFFESNLILRNFKLIDGIINAYIIDVGASTRLYNHMIARLILRPILDCQDYIRTNKFDMNLGVIFNLTLQTFMKKYYKFIKKYKPVFNFTDVLYYISEFELLEFAKYLDYGLIGLGTLHIFKNHSVNVQQKLVELGIITFTENEINMKVMGNETVYRHSNIFNCLAVMDYYNLKGNGYYINIVKQLSVDFDSTIYVSFIMIKSSEYMISPTLNLNYFVDNMIENKQNSDNNYIIKSVLNYKLNYKLSFSDLLKEEHINAIIVKFLYNMDMKNIFERIKLIILDLSLEIDFA